MSAAQNIVDFVRGFGQRRTAARVRDASRNYLTDPAGTISQIMQIDPDAGYKLNTQYQATRKAADDARQKQINDHWNWIGGALRDLPQGSDYGAAFDNLIPQLRLRGVGDDEIAAARQTITSNPGILSSLDDATHKARVDAQYGAHVLTPGSALNIGGKRVDYAPFSRKAVTVKGGDGSSTLYDYDPNSGGAASAIGSGAPSPSVGMGAGSLLSVDSLRPHIVDQESGGDYTSVNPQTGALGAYQVMPDTGRALAARVGLAWRPDLMVSDSPEGHKYQDAVGGAAIKDALDHSGGDPRTAFSYYYAGPDRSKWGPNTRQYANDMMGRVGGGAGAPGTPPPAGGQDDGNILYQSSPKPPAPSKQVRTLTPAEIAAAGYPAGSIVQVDPNGKQTVTYKPSASSQGGGQNGLSKTQIGAARQKLASLNAIEAQLNRVRQTMTDAEKGGWTGWVGGHVPGALDPKSDAFDKSVATLGALVRQLTRTPGEGSMSDYESRLAAMTLPSRTDSHAGRVEAINGLSMLIKNIRSGYRDMLGDASGAGTPTPKATSPDPRTLKPGTILTRTVNGKTQRAMWNGRALVPVQ